MLLLAAGLTLFATAGHDLLPVIMHGGDYSLLVTRSIGSVMWVLTTAVLLVLWFRAAPTVLDLWLTVVMFAWSLDIAFSGIAGFSRYDLGFYAGRIYGFAGRQLRAGRAAVRNEPAVTPTWRTPWTWRKPATRR